MIPTPLSNFPKNLVLSPKTKPPDQQNGRAVLQVEVTGIAPVSKRFEDARLQA